MRSAHGGDNFIGSEIQTKGFGCILCSFRKRLIEWKTPRFNRRLVRVAKNPSTVFTHGHETDLVRILQDLHDKGVGLLLHQQGLGTTSSVGKAMFQMLGVFAEFEQGIIRQRVNAGLARARANGDKLGRRREPVRRGASGLLLQRELTLHKRRLILGVFHPSKSNIV
jgi:DNA invertase Pin-like site-specific DNA recombinase